MPGSPGHERRQAPLRELRHHAARFDARRARGGRLQSRGAAAGSCARPHARAGGLNYGAEDAKLFLDKIVPVAPSIEIVVAHFGGSGPGYPAQADEVMAVFGAAAERKDPRMRNLYFDVATIVTPETTTEEAALVVRRVRQVGASRVLYGSDLSPPGGSIRSGWEIFRERVPLTDAEFWTIAINVTRFAR